MLFSSLIAFLSGLLASLGLGGGSILLLFLTFTGMEQLAAQGVNLLFVLPVGAVALFLHRKNGLVSLAAAFPMAAGGLVGLGAGVLLAGRLTGGMLSRLLGALMLLIAIREARGAVTLFRQEGLSLLKAPPKEGPAGNPGRKGGPPEDDPA